MLKRQLESIIVLAWNVMWWLNCSFWYAAINNDQLVSRLNKDSSSKTMTYLSILFWFLPSILAQKSGLYGKINLPSNYDWGNKLYSTTSYQTSIIECGSACLADQNCELYTIDNNSLVCYLGLYSQFSTGPTLLTLPQNEYGYLDLTKFNAVVKDKYFQVSGITYEESKRILKVSESTDFVDCAFGCYDINDQCTIFIFKVWHNISN